MPRGKGEPISEPRENLTLFGEWFYHFCDDYFHVSMYFMAQRMKINADLLSKNTRDPRKVKSARRPTRETLDKISQTFAQLAQEQNLPWLRESKTILYHAAGYATDEECEYASQALIVSKMLADRKK